MPDDSSTMTLGEALRRKREQRGIELTQIAEITRIGVRFLRAIEDNDFKILPGGVYTRSFIRTYARQVGLDEETAIALYAQQTGDAQEKKYDLSTDAIRAKVRAARWANAVIFLVMVAVVAIGGYAAWHYWHRTQTASPPQPPAAPGPRARPPSDTGVRPSPAERAPAPPVTGQPTTAPTDLAEQPPTPEQPITTGPPPVEATPATTNLRLNIAAQGDCWISVRADDAEPQRRTLHQGESLSLSANTRLIITAGNVPRLKVTINGQSVALPQTGVVAREVVITPNTLQRFVNKQ
jgi:cytoskeletal protein RodZ